MVQVLGILRLQLNAKKTILIREKNVTTKKPCRRRDKDIDAINLYNQAIFPNKSFKKNVNLLRALRRVAPREASALHTTDHHFFKFQIS